MSKIYTDDAFEEIVTQDFVWRLKEISSLKTAIRKSSSNEQTALLRAFVALLYAHWEGHVKFCATSYFEFLTLKKLRFSQLRGQMYRNYFMAKLDALSLQKSSLAQKCSLIDEILTSANDRFSRINPRLVDTGSNLKFEILMNICQICDVDRALFADDEDFLDRVVLKRRNSIAHGEEIYIGLDELDPVSEKALELMRKFRDALQNKVALREFLAV